GRRLPLLVAIEQVHDGVAEQRPHRQDRGGGRSAEMAERAADQPAEQAAAPVAALVALLAAPALRLGGGRQSEGGQDQRNGQENGTKHALDTLRCRGKKSYSRPLGGSIAKPVL